MGKFNTSRNPQQHKRYKKNLPYKEFSQQTIEMMWRSEIWGSGNIGKERAMGILPGNYCKGASVQLGSVTQPCLTLQPHGLQHATPGFTQTQVHWVGDAIQPPHPLSSPSPPALNLSQHQGLFKWVSSLYQVAKVVEFQLQHQSFQWTPRADLL